MKSILILTITTLFSISIQAQTPKLKEFQILLPKSADEIHNINITFTASHTFVLCEFDRLVEGSVQIYINNEPTPQIINLGQCQQFIIDQKVRHLKISFQTQTDLWIRFQK